MKNEVLKLFNGLSVKEDLKEHEKLQEKVNEVNRETIPYGVIVDKKQKIAGIVEIGEEANTFYFTEMYMGNSITSSRSEYGEMAREYMLTKYKNAYLLSDILKEAGANVYYDLSEDEEIEIDYDLSLTNVSKDSILELLS